MLEYDIGYMVGISSLWMASPSESYPPDTCTHIQACTHIHMQARTHTACTHTRMHTYVYVYAACTHTRNHARTYTRTHVTMHVCTHAHTHERTHARTHARTHTRTYVHSHVHIPSMHTHITKISFVDPPRPQEGCDGQSLTSVHQWMEALSDCN